MISICAISDLHGTLPEIKECDLCLIAGDVVSLDVQRDRTQSIIWFFKKFLPWVKELPCKEVIMVAGNHDFLISSDRALARALEYLSDFKLTYLENNYTTFSKENQRITIYGSPQCHKFGSWVFMHNESFLKELYSSVENNVDIWLTHDTPMLGDLDLLPPNQWNKEAIHAGGKSLAAAILEKEPKYVFCGHLHTCKDKYLNTGKTEIYNVSILDNSYAHVYEPTYVEIN